MLHQLKWNDLITRRHQSKVTMIYRVIHQLVAIPSAPYLQPTGVRTKGNDMRFLAVDDLWVSFLGKVYNLTPLCEKYTGIFFFITRQESRLNSHVQVLFLLPLVCMIPLEHFRTIDYVHVRDVRLVYLQKITGAG
jgi:hypothetical protein